MFDGAPLSTEDVAELHQEKQLFNVPVEVERTEQGIMIVRVLARSQEEADTRVKKVLRYLEIAEVDDWEETDSQVVGMCDDSTFNAVKVYRADIDENEFEQTETKALLQIAAREARRTAAK